MIFKNNKKIKELEKLIGKQNELFYGSYKKNHKEKFKTFSDEVFKTLTEYLNNIHNLSLSQTSWKIIIGPWFYSFLNIYFYYNFCFNKKKTLNKKIKNIILKLKLKNKEYIPNSFSDYIQFMYSRDSIIQFIYCMLSENFFIPKSNKIKLKSNSFIKTFFFKFFFFIGGSKVILSRPRFNKIDQVKIYIFSKLKILSIPSFENMFKVIKSNEKSNIRKLIIKNLNKKTKNFNIIRILFYYIPTSYLENLKEYEKMGERLIPNSKVIYSDSTYISDEIFKIQLAKSKSKKFIGQHGGNFRIYGKNQINVHERDVADKYIVWGKKLMKNEDKLPSPKIDLFYQTHKNKIKNHKTYDFCYVLPPIKNSNFRYLFHNSSNDLLEVKERINLFNNTKKNFIIKSYGEETRYSDQIHSDNLFKLFSINRSKFSNNKEILFQSKFLIFDYMSTMIFEIINLKIPFILILNVKKHNFTNEGKKLINYIKKMNILFKNHKQALKFINSDIDINSWWYKKKNQQILKKISNDFCSLEKNCLNTWVDFFEKNL